MAQVESYSFCEELTGLAKLVTRGCLGTAIAAAVDSVYTSQAAPRSTFLQSPPSDVRALRAWAHASGHDIVSAGGMRFAVWVRTAPTLHTSLVCKLQRAYCSAPCYRWGDHMVYNCVAIVAGTLMGIRAVLRDLLHEGHNVL